MNKKEIKLNYEIKFYSIYKKIYNELGEQINEIITTTKDTIQEVMIFTKLQKTQVYNIINNKEENALYNIYIDYINIKDYVKGL